MVGSVRGTTLITASLTLVSSPFWFPTRLPSALARDVVVVREVVSALSVLRLVVVLCTGGAPSASASAGLTRVRSASDCVVSLDVVSRHGTSAVADVF